MRKRARQISLQECYTILRLKSDADMADVKRAYRRRAFELHPDLNPGNPDASHDFQQLNEAYVALSAVLKHEESMRAERVARRAANAKAKEQQRSAKEAAEESETSTSASASAQTAQEPEPEQPTAAQGEKESVSSPTGNKAADEEQKSQKAAAGKATSASGEKSRAQNAYTEHDVLRDLLNDPFARRVFEDIYSELNRQQKDEPQPQANPEPEKAQAKPTSTEKRTVKLHQSNLAWGTPKWNKQFSKGVTGMVKGWLRRQIDEEQSLTLPAANLAPGKRIRLQIRQALSGELKTVEITLPPDFAVGKPIRLRGLGKRVGPWQGDLYLVLFNE